MKNIFILIVIVLCFVSVLRHKFFSEEIAKVKFNAFTIHIGSISQNTIKYGKFILKDVGDLPIKIKKVHPDCNCTLVKIDSISGRNKQEYYIDVAFDNRMKGYFKREVEVFTNASPKAELLTITGIVY
ncbi:MAG: DUF1573 domain-containing protein [Pseudarcicella sp.]|nr:DUF1573 domain-containing protein [Pseudarcicella sp.]